jgi:hypothetical protein
MKATRFTGGSLLRYIGQKKVFKGRGKKMDGGEINVRGIFYLVDLIRLFNCIYKEALQYEPSVDLTWLFGSARKSMCLLMHSS